MRVSPSGGSHLLMGRWRRSNVGAKFRNPGRRSVGLLIRVIVVRPPKRRQVPAEVQFEVARNAVTDIADLGTARLCTGQGQHWEEQVVARLKLGSCRRPEPIDLGLLCDCFVAYIRVASYPPAPPFAA